MSGRRFRTRRRAELSQHFLKSRALAAKLVAQSSISEQDLIVEIGPGTGMLTRELADRCRHLIAVEIDQWFAKGLLDVFSGNPRVKVVCDDFLKLRLPERPYKVFANVPFNRTADIVRRLVNAPLPPEDAYLIVQREAAERFAGWPYASETVASMLLKPWWHVEIAVRLNRTDFDPPPGVEVVLLWLARRPRPLVDQTHQQFYRRFMSDAFGRDGNTVRSSLKRYVTRAQIRRLAQDLSFDQATPPSSLSFDQWLGVFRFAALSRNGRAYA